MSTDCSFYTNSQNCSNESTVSAVVVQTAGCT